MFTENLILESMTTIPYKSNFSDLPITMFDDRNGIISISGRAIQIDSNKFWSKMKIRLKNHMKNSKSITSIRFQMEYVNSSSVEQLLDFLKLSKTLANNENKLEIQWFYEDPYILELGNCLNEIVELPMKYIHID